MGSSFLTLRDMTHSATLFVGLLNIDSAQLHYDDRAALSLAGWRYPEVSDEAVSLFMPPYNLSHELPPSDGVHPHDLLPDDRADIVPRILHLDYQLPLIVPVATQPVANYPAFHADHR